MRETWWKNNLNFAKDIPMMCAYCIITVIIVSDEKVGGVTFVLLFIHIRYLQQYVGIYCRLLGFDFESVQLGLLSQAFPEPINLHKYVTHILTPIVLNTFWFLEYPSPPLRARNCNSSHYKQFYKLNLQSSRI